MFGKSDDNQQVTMGSPTVQNPSMLDSITPQDFESPQTQTSSTATTTPSQPFSNFNDPATAPVTAATTPTIPTVEHPITTDNPFAATDVETTSEQPMQSMQSAVPAMPVTDDTSASAVPSVLSDVSSSGPVDPPAAPVIVTSDVTSSDDTSSSSDSSAPSDDTAATESDSKVDTERLAGMKQQALEELEPLVGHLSQNPEDEFRTTMMMIQANDNHTLLEKALEAAKKIEDDKVRAQALLDIINEINYFSQNSTSTSA